MKKTILFLLLFSLIIPSFSAGEGLYEDQLNKGIRNSEPYSYLLIKQAKTNSAQAKNILLREAIRYSPDLPAGYFELSKASFSVKPEAVFEALDYMIQGIGAYQRNFWWSFMMIASLFASLLLSFTVSILILIMIRLPEDMPLLSHDIREIRPKALLFLALVFSVFGPLYVLGGLLIIISFYMKKWDRIVLYLYLLFLLVTPWLMNTVSLFLKAPASGELRAVVQVNESKGNRYALSVLNGRNDPVELFSYALALKREGRYSEAIETYSKLITVRPDPLAYNNLANCYVAINDLEKAKELYRKSKEMKPRPSVLYNLSQVSRETLDFDKGDEYFLAAQKLDHNAVSRFRSIAGRNPNRFVIDESLPASVILDYTKRKTSRTSATGLSAVSPVIMAVFALLMAALFYILDQRFKPWAYRCNRCGKILCSKCEKHILWGHMCSQCYRSLVKLDELDAKERIAKLITVYEHKKKRRDIIKVLSFIIPGSGQMYAGNIMSGLLFLWPFLFFLFIPIMNSVFVIELSDFSHLWLNLSSLFFMAVVYFASNIITRRRLAKGWL
jgi:pentatricopeptide repeat protein